MSFIWSLLVSRWGGWIVGATLLGLAAWGGSIYVRHLQGQVQDLKAQVVAAKRALEIREHDIKVDKEIAHEKGKVDRLTPAELDAEFERLREYGRSRKGAADP